MLVALHMQLYGRWIVDDAAITFAYARSLAAGEGAVLQPGADPVEGYSNPAWLAVLVLGRWLGLFDHGTWFGVPDLVVFPKLVALLYCAGVFAGFYAVDGAPTAGAAHSGRRGGDGGRFEIIDVAGLASAPIAQFWRAGDIPGLRDYVFDEVRPGFIETHGFWSGGTGIVADPRMTADYVPIHLTDDRSGWWVRRDLVPSRERLAAAREWAATVAVPQNMRYGVDAPRSSCGDTLTPGTATLG